MSISYIGDLIESAKNKIQPFYIRKGWVLTARNRLDKANKELIELEDELKKGDEA